MTMERPGCAGKPGLACCVLAPMCADGMTVHAGELSGSAGDVMLSGPTVMGYAQVPSPFGGMFTPTVNIMDRGSGNQFRPVGKLEGPTLFGGCSELCFDSHFAVSKMGQEHVGKSAAIKTADLANIIKRKPATAADALKEAFTDSDQFTLEFVDTSLTAQQKAVMIASVLLVDYMFFEMDNGMIDCHGSKIKTTCCLCYCLGALQPCTCRIETRQDLTMFKSVLQG